ncbi:hypothetical protein ACOJUR_12400 [Alicyclobacillus tolerans]|uniref:hypothetical protein n=1 Tax=Alicyclobacillus tolerans TaxID=90970 RepID=UPI003B809323
MAYGDRKRMRERIPLSASRWYPQGLPVTTAEEWYELFDRVDEPWTEEDEAYLKEWYFLENTLDLALALGKHPWQVQQYAQRRLGLYKLGDPHD